MRAIRRQNRALWFDLRPANGRRGNTVRANRRSVRLALDNQALHLKEVLAIALLRD
jgi:hypothetical protein